MIRELSEARDELGKSAEREAALQRRLAGKDVEIGMAAGEAENAAMRQASDAIKSLTLARDRAEAAQVQAEAGRESAESARAEAHGLLMQAKDKILALTGEVMALKERREAWGGGGLEGDGPSTLGTSRPHSRDGGRPPSRKGYGVPPHVGSVQQAQILEVDTGTPLDSPIQMPPYPVTPSVAHFFVGTDTMSRPTTADSEAGGGAVRTASGEGDFASENKRLRSVIGDMRREMERLQQLQGAMRDSAGRVEQLELERRELAAKLAKAEAHVKRLQAERDRLITENNGLRADLRRVVDGAERFGAALSDSLEDEEWGEVVGVADAVGGVLAQGTRIRQQLGGRHDEGSHSGRSEGGGVGRGIGGGSGSTGGGGGGNARRQLENNLTGHAVSSSSSYSEPPLIAGGNIWSARTRIPKGGSGHPHDRRGSGHPPTARQQDE